MSEDETAAKVESVDKWYGIVDGNYSNKAIRWLISKKSEWKDALWFVTLLQGGFPTESYRQLARFQNQSHSDSYYISLTFCYELLNLRQEYDRMSDLKAKINTMITKSYFGGNIVSRTMKLLTSFSIRLSHDVIETIGLIMNSENPELYTTNDYMDYNTVLD